MDTEDTGPDPTPPDLKAMYAEVHAYAERHAVIEQAKGMLMFIYGLDADAAFGLLRWQSQQHNVKLHLIAEQLVKDLAELATQHPVDDRLRHDRALLTAHYRVTHVADRQRDGQSKTDA